VGDTKNVKVQDGEMGLYVERPKGAARGAVIVIQEAFGVTDHIKNVCRRFADDGYVGVAPHVFHRSGDPIIPYDNMQAVIPHIMQLSLEGLEADVDAALAFLKGEGFEPSRVAIVGFCMGGSVAAMIAKSRKIGAAVSYYGGGITQGRFGSPPLIELAPNFQTPWLGQYGDADLTIPFTEVEMMRKAAKSAPAPTDIFRYDEAEHGFNCDERPSFHPESAKLAWGRTLEWLGAHLR
jgi:carboxymethylenebutenolidase